MENLKVDFNELLRDATDEELKLVLNLLKVVLPKYKVKQITGEDVYFTLTELESVLSVTHRTLQRWIADGELSAEKVAGKWRVSVENLTKFMENRNAK